MSSIKQYKRITISIFKHLYNVQYYIRGEYKLEENIYIDDFSERLFKLRHQKGVSAREMSLSIGQTHNLINNIELGKNFPSMLNFFYICEYLQISPQEFF